MNVPSGGTRSSNFLPLLDSLTSLLGIGYSGCRLSVARQTWLWQMNSIRSTVSGGFLSSVSGPAVINRLHDFLGPAHRVRNCTHCRRDSFPAIELSQLACS